MICTTICTTRACSVCAVSWLLTAHLACRPYDQCEGSRKLRVCKRAPPVTSVSSSSISSKRWQPSTSMACVVAESAEQQQHAVMLGAPACHCNLQDTSVQNTDNDLNATRLPISIMHDVIASNGCVWDSPYCLRYPSLEELLHTTRRGTCTRCQHGW